MPAARLAADSPTTATSRKTRTSSTSCTSDRLVAHDAAELPLADLAPLQQQVDVPEHLAQCQVGLRDGHVAPQRLRHLVGRAGLTGQQVVDLARAPLVQGEALVDQRGV